MNPREAYNVWAEQYDTNENKTRDLEGRALRDILSQIEFSACLEIGCGTGKNTAWLVQHADHITAVDLSEQMLAKAKEKIISSKVEFLQANINEDWAFLQRQYDLATFSLVLEHIENLEPILEKTAQALTEGGHVYIGELHPFKQYSGSKARFDTEEGRTIVECYNHHISDFIQAGKKAGLAVVDIAEYFDNDDRNGLPRVLSILLKKQ